MAVTIYYDGDCPLCKRYVRLLRLRRAAGSVHLVDLRNDAAMRRDLEREGFELDQGMVVDTDGRRLGGADAVHALALLSTPSDRFNRANRFILSSRQVAAVAYPVLRSGRWLILFMLGRQRFAARQPGPDARTEIFASFFALFSIFHFFNYAFEYGRFPPQWDQVALLLSAFVLLLNPRSERALWLVMLASAISTVVQAPVHSNHTMVRSAVVAGYWASFLYAMVRGIGWPAVFANFTTAGQGTLLVMYVFGVFHKINTDFLNPETSCAMALWHDMPAPLVWLDGPFISHATVYGTFAVEGAIVAMLLTTRFRHYGIVCGIAFHVLIALTGYAMYLTFTTLAVALHTLFLSEQGARRVVGSRGMAMLRVRVRNPVYALAGAVLIAVLAYAALTGRYSLATLAALPFVAPFALLVARHGRSTQPLLAPSASGTRRPNPSIVIGAVVTTLFFANCTMPYLGLKSAQALNMFANLRLEGGVSNHLLLPNPPGPFGYLADVAVIEDSGGDGTLEGYRQAGFAIVYYDLLVRLEENPGLVVGFTRDGRTVHGVSAADVADDIADKLHPAWFRKWFHFQPVTLDRPEPCS